MAAAIVKMHPIEIMVLATTRQIVSQCGVGQ
jgi:hypothetical protein